MNFSSQIFFNDINHGYKAALLEKSSLWLLSIYMDVACYCYYEKGRRMNARSLNIFILFQLQSWIILRVRTIFLLRNFHVKRVIFETAMMNISNNCIAGCSVYSIAAWKSTYLKNYSKTFNALILTRYSYPKQTTYCT